MTNTATKNPLYYGWFRTDITEESIAQAKLIADGFWHQITTIGLTPAQEQRVADIFASAVVLANGAGRDFGEAVAEILSED